MASMDNLRLVLILTGICIITGIYLWDRIQRKKSGDRRRISAVYNEEETQEVIITAKMHVDDDYSSELADLNSFLADEDLDEGEDGAVDAGMTEDDNPGISAGDELLTGTEDINPHSIITLYITAVDNEALPGSRIIESLTFLGFQFGEMDIFHYYDPKSADSGPPLFSLADMYEPGYFEIADIDRFSTRGLSVFIRLATLDDPEAGFTRMLDISGQLADMLGARVCGPDRSPLDQDTVNRLTHLARNYGQ